jgi:hypothetical protein
MDVAAWAKRPGLPVKTLHPPVIDEVRPYVNDDPVAREEFRKHRASLERSQTLVTIDEATIRDVVGFVELPDGQICYEGNWWLPYLQSHPAYPIYKATRPTNDASPRGVGDWVATSTHCFACGARNFTTGFMMS